MRSMVKCLTISMLISLSVTFSKSWNIFQYFKLTNFHCKSEPTTRKFQKKIVTLINIFPQNGKLFVLLQLYKMIMQISVFVESSEVNYRAWSSLDKGESMSFEVLWKPATSSKLLLPRREESKQTQTKWSNK